MDQTEVIIFFKKYIAPRIKYLLYFENDSKNKLYEKFSRILQTCFTNSGINMTRCSQYLKDVEKEEEIKNVIENYHEDFTNHRGMDEMERSIRILLAQHEKNNPKIYQ